MWTNFSQFITSVLQPIRQILSMISPGLGTFIGAVCAFLVLLAIKRGVSH